MPNQDAIVVAEG